MILVYFCIFFFQAEDGIRDGHVTRVQTCALPIFEEPFEGLLRAFRQEVRLGRVALWRSSTPNTDKASRSTMSRSSAARSWQIGRASCRERESISGGAVG